MEIPGSFFPLQESFFFPSVVQQVERNLANLNMYYGL